MSTRTTTKPVTGSVRFVGAGPGDPGLLTIRGVTLLAGADVVVLDRVAGPVHLQHCRSDVEIVDGLRDAGGHDLTYAQRAKVLIKHAKAGKHVVRLMDGDAAGTVGFAEEALACAKAGVPFEIVPGVPGATSVPAYAGIPVNTASSAGFNVVSPHAKKPDWHTHVADDVTVVVPGDLKRIIEAVDGLLDAGRDATTPVAVTSSGTTTAQRTIVSTLSGIAGQLSKEKVEAPLVATIGSVVGLRDVLSWFETKPLFGWRVLVPRTKEQAGALSEQLRRFGAIPEEVPTISVEPPRNPQQVDRAIQGLVAGRYLWVAFTSVNAVKAIREKFEEYGLDARAFAGLKVAAVGEQTAAALLAFGVKPDLVPAGEQSSAGLLEDFPEYDDVLDPINRVFLPRADIATESLAAGLVDLGWEVEDVTAYRTVRAAPPAAAIRDAIKAGGFDAVVFTSSSTVRNLVGIAGKPHPATAVAVIGPQTAKTAEEHGLRVDVLSADPNMKSLAESLAEYGTALRAAALEAGEPEWRPSLRKNRARKAAAKPAPKAK